MHCPCVTEIQLKHAHANLFAKHQCWEEWKMCAYIILKARQDQYFCYIAA